MKKEIKMRGIGETAEHLSLRCTKGLAHKLQGRFAVVQNVVKVLSGMEKK